MRNLIEDVRKFVKYVNAIKFVYYNREANKLANRIAKRAHVFNTSRNVYKNFLSSTKKKKSFL